MARKSGSLNIIPWEVRKCLPTTPNDNIKHLAFAQGVTALEEFERILSHQANYLAWIDGRQQSLLQLSSKKHSLRGPKDATYRKYRWYAEQQCVLDAIASLEVFYKRSFIGLADGMRSYIPAERIKGAVDGKVLWGLRGKASVPALLFEHQLFHGTDAVDQVSYMLVDAKRYNAASSSTALRSTIRGLQAAFQVRHTLAHNQGYVTTSDAAKFELIGLNASKYEVLDFEKEKGSTALRKFLRKEAVDFTLWLLDACAKFLDDGEKAGKFDLRVASFKRLESRVGKTPKLSRLNWK